MNQYYNGKRHHRSGRYVSLKCFFGFFLLSFNCAKVSKAQPLLYLTKKKMHCGKAKENKTRNKIIASSNA